MKQIKIVDFENSENHHKIFLMNKGRVKQNKKNVI